MAISSFKAFDIPGVEGPDLSFLPELSTYSPSIEKDSQSYIREIEVTQFLTTPELQNQEDVNFRFSDIDLPPSDIEGMFLSIAPQQAALAQAEIQDRKSKHAKKLEEITSQVRNIASQLKPLPMEGTSKYIKRLKNIKECLERLSSEITSLTIGANFEKEKFDEAVVVANDIERRLESISILRKEAIILEAVASQESLKLAYNKYREEANRLESVLNGLVPLKQAILRIQDLKKNAKRSEYNSRMLKLSLDIAEANFASCSEKARHASYVANTFRGIVIKDPNSIVDDQRLFEIGLQVMQDTMARNQYLAGEALFNETLAKQAMLFTKDTYLNQIALAVQQRKHIEQIIQKEHVYFRYNGLDAAIKEKNNLSKLEEEISKAEKIAAKSAKEVVMHVRSEYIESKKEEFLKLASEVESSQKMAVSAKKAALAMINIAEKAMAEIGTVLSQINITK